MTIQITLKADEIPALKAIEFYETAKKYRAEGNGLMADVYFGLGYAVAEIQWLISSRQLVFPRRLTISVVRSRRL